MDAHGAQPRPGGRRHPRGRPRCGRSADRDGFGVGGEEPDRPEDADTQDAGTQDSGTQDADAHGTTGDGPDDDPPFRTPDPGEVGRS